MNLVAALDAVRQYASGMIEGPDEIAPSAVASQNEQAMAQLLAMKAQMK